MAGFGDSLGPLLIIGLFVPLLALWIVAYVDLARRSTLSVARKGLWAVAMFFGAYFGIAAYFLMRPVAPPVGKEPSATSPRSSAIVTDLETLRQDHTNGVLTDDDYLARKRDLLGLT